MTTTRENNSEIAPEIVVVNLRDLTETRQDLQDLCNNYIIIENTISFVFIIICVSLAVIIIYNLLVFVAKIR